MPGVSQQGTPGISIHAPREGSDKETSMRLIDANISIHAPREGSDYTVTIKTSAPFKFQSTLPGRGATTTPVYSD